MNEIVFMYNMNCTKIDELAGKRNAKMSILPILMPSK